MRFFVVAFCVAAASAKTQIPAKPVTRTLPADVLRDFPGACFALTICRVFQVGETWPLSPFCGKASCLQEGGKLIEKVEDCGLQPKISPDCHITNEADLQKAFPTCCPAYECPAAAGAGASLQYHTPEEIKAAAQAPKPQAAAQAGQTATA